MAQAKNPNRPFKDIPVLFDDIISALSEKIKEKGAMDVLYRISQYSHDIRDELQHRITFTLKNKFDDYLEDIISLCEYMNFDIEHKVMKQKNGITKNILYKISEENRDERFRRLDIIGEFLNKNFQIVHGNYRPDIVLTCTGDTLCANMNVEAIISGSFHIENKKCRVLELLIDENIGKSHTLLISYTGSNIWYCFYKCFGSKHGMDEKIDIKNIKNFIELNKEKIDYIQINASQSYSYNSLNKYLELKYPDFNPLFIKPGY